MHSPRFSRTSHLIFMTRALQTPSVRHVLAKCAHHTHSLQIPEVPSPTCAVVEPCSRRGRPNTCETIRRKLGHLLERPRLAAGEEAVRAARTVAAKPLVGSARAEAKSHAVAPPVGPSLVEAPEEFCVAAISIGLGCMHPRRARLKEGGGQHHGEVQPRLLQHRCRLCYLIDEVPGFRHDTEDVAAHLQREFGLTVHGSACGSSHWSPTMFIDCSAYDETTLEFRIDAQSRFDVPPAISDVDSNGTDATVVLATSAALRALDVVATETVPVHLFQVESTWTAIMRRTPRAHCDGHRHDTHQVFQGGLATPTCYLPHANTMETAARLRHGACHVESCNKFRYKFPLVSLDRCSVNFSSERAVFSERTGDWDQLFLPCEAHVSATGANRTSSRTTRRTPELIQRQVKKSVRAWAQPPTMATPGLPWAFMLSVCPTTSTLGQDRKGVHMERCWGGSAPRAYRRQGHAT